VGASPVSLDREVPVCFDGGGASAEDKFPSGRVSSIVMCRARCLGGMDLALVDFSTRRFSSPTRDLVHSVLLAGIYWRATEEERVSGTAVGISAGSAPEA